MVKKRCGATSVGDPKTVPREGADLPLDGISEEVQEDAGAAKLHLAAWLSGAWATLG